MSKQSAVGESVLHVMPTPTFSINISVLLFLIIEPIYGLRPQENRRYLLLPILGNSTVRSLPVLASPDSAMVVETNLLCWRLSKLGAPTVGFPKQQLMLEVPSSKAL